MPALISHHEEESMIFDLPDTGWWCPQASLCPLGGWQGWNHAEKTKARAKTKFKAQNPRRANKSIHFHLKPTGEHRNVSWQQRFPSPAIIFPVGRSRQATIQSFVSILFQTPLNFHNKIPKPRGTARFGLETMSNSVVLLRFVLKPVRTEEFLLTQHNLKILNSFTPETESEI